MKADEELERMADLDNALWNIGEALKYVDDYVIKTHLETARELIKGLLKKDETRIVNRAKEQLEEVKE